MSDTIIINYPTDEGLTINIDDNDDVIVNIIDEPNIIVNLCDDLGTTANNYDYLDNKPSINNVELVGNKTLDDLGIEPAKGADNNFVTDAEKSELHSHSNKTVLDSIIQSSIDAWNIAYNWVSSNGAVVLSHIADSSIHVTSTLLSTINNKVDKVEGKGLSTNDFTNEQKELLSQQSGVNTGDQDLSGLEPKRGTDDFYVTNAEKTQGALATGNTVLHTVKDLADNLELIGTNFTISLNFVELYSSDFFNEVDFKIVNIETNPTQLITIIVNNVAYTIGNTISKFDKVTITPSITGYVILNCEVV